MAGQESFTPTIRESIAGMLFGSWPHQIERLSLESGECPFGYGVIAGTGETQALLPSGAVTVDALRGVTRRNENIERKHLSADDPVYDYEYNNAMDVVRKGPIWVATTSLLVRSGPIFFQHTTSGANLAGTFRNTVDGGNAVDVSSVAAVYRGNDVAGEPAVVEFNILG